MINIIIAAIIVAIYFFVFKLVYAQRSLSQAEIFEAVSVLPEKYQKIALHEAKVAAHVKAVNRRSMNLIVNNIKKLAMEKGDIAVTD